MTVAYLVIAVVSLVAFTMDMLLRYVEKIKRFGLEKDLFVFHGKTIPVENFIPHNLTMIFVFCFAFGLCGIALDLMGFMWYISLFCALIFAMAVNYSEMFFIPLIKKQALPKDFDLSGMGAVVTDFISGDGWGKVKLVYKGREYLFNAVSANETDIDEGEKVTVVLENDGMLFVEREDEVFEPLKEIEEKPKTDE